MVREAVCTNVKSCIFPQSWTTVAQTGCALLLYALSGDAAHFSCFLTAGIFRSSTRLNDWTWSCIITLAFIISSVTLPSIMVVIAVAASAVAASAAIVEEVVLFQTAVVKVDFFSSFVVYTNRLYCLAASSSLDLISVQQYLAPPGLFLTQWNGPDGERALCPLPFLFGEQ